ncbi:MAG: hypothetical protein KGL53_13510, partial [Elusimicrobia bacterium]|nr:hypothetical protein [Elusimicrobiota bacterium]
MLAAPLLVLLAAPARAAASVAYTAALTLQEDGLVRVVETVRPIGELDRFCGPLSRRLPLKRPGPWGLRRLARAEVTGAFRGTGVGLRPVPWTLLRGPRGAELQVGAASSPPDCALTLLYEEEPSVVPSGAGAVLSFPLPSDDLGVVLRSGTVSLSGTRAPVRLVLGRGGVSLAEGRGSLSLPASLPPGRPAVFEAEVPAPPARREGARRLLADNLHAAVGAAGLLLLVLFYALIPAGREWELLAAGGALSSGTVAAMRLAEAPALIGPKAALAALETGLAAGLA